MSGGQHDALIVAGISFVCSTVAALVGAAVVTTLRKRSFAVTAAVVSLVTVAAVSASTVASAQEMFISDQDSRLTLIIVGTSGVFAVLAAVGLGGPAVAGVATLREAARRLGDESFEPLPTPPTSELAGLADELESTHTRLVEARERERALEASRRELIAWVSHDLRTPLAGIRAMAEALEDGVVNDQVTVTRYLRRMRVDADRLAGMVDDLFQLSRLNAGTLRLSPSRVLLNDIVSDALAAADPLARAKGVRLLGQSAPTVAIEVDVREISRVLANLLVNAIRHTPGGGAVEVAAGWARASNPIAYLSVRDSCGGIPPDDLARLFDVGFRGEVARSPAATGPVGAAAGAGLGLAIARGIVEAHEGEIQVRNAPGGCRFLVKLPLRARPAAFLQSPVMP
ncbi:MAG: sensor histidine kinase [Frankia sp.]